MADPISWLMIRPGWKVYASDGTEVGAVNEVAGDDNADIFDGLAIATSALGEPTYVPSESVGPITEGRIELTLNVEQVAALGAYLEPATSRIIEGDNKPGSAIGAEVRELETKAFLPVERERSVGFGRRIRLLLRRARG
jgi:sporulation protein YlmC with PRC-barrel domain